MQQLFRILLYAIQSFCAGSAYIYGNGASYMEF
jgi:hypothetical protein